MAERGYAGATLRDVAARVGVSPALLYRYFPGKRDVVLALYDDLSEAFAREAADLPPGRWRLRVVWALERSLAVLGPHRVTMRALAPVLVGDAEDGVFATRTALSRARVQAVFHTAVAGASDAPKAPLAAAVGRLCYLAHLGVVLWWLLDRSPGQRATTALVTVLRDLLPSVSLALQLPPVRRAVRALDGLVGEALLDEAG